MSSKTYEKQFSSMILPGVMSAIGISVLIALGTWQLQRLEQKQVLIANTQARTQMAPIQLAPQSRWAQLDLDALEYRPVKLSGRFLHEHEMPLFTYLSKPKGKYGGPGYWIITPFATNDGIVLVNRGFVPEHMKHSDARMAGQTKAGIEITGLLRANERVGLFTPENRPQTNEWYFRDARAMARHITKKNVTPFFVDMITPIPEGGVPQPGETRLKFTNKHWGYAITWYSLALVLAGVFTVFFFQNRRAK